jgi:diguanylate cyclase (GGDEF)-like protein/putative nucleotidyltransferase with HDIG domain
MTGNPITTARPSATSGRSHVFVLVAAALGFAELISLGFNWHSADSRRFVIYLILTSVSSFVHLNRMDRSGGFSLSLPFVLLGIVDLSTREAVAIGCLAIAIQNLRAPEGWSFRQLGLSLGVQATIVATASFMFHVLAPAWVKDSPVRLVIAAAALFVANTFPAAIMRRLTGEQRLGELWRSWYFWAFPYYLIAGALAQMVHQGRAAVSSSSSLLALIALYLAYRHYHAQKMEWRMRAKHADDVTALHLRAIEGLALAVEAKDNMNTRGHIRRVQVYALGIGKSMGLNGVELEALQAGSLLHDIGKLAVPEHILTKPGKLTPEEFARMKVHPLVGAEIVEQMKFPYPVAPIVRAHHERWDGSGYPYGLKGEDIPLGARILSVADWLDAMVSDREYRKGIPIEEAMRQIVAGSGVSFDPAVVAALQPQFEKLAQSARKQAAQGPVLSTDVAVDNRATPGAGLDLCGLPDVAHGGDFLTTISAAAREQQLLSATAQAASSLDLAETMQRIEAALRAKIPHDAMAVFVPEANVLKAAFAVGQNREHLLGLEVPAGDGLIGWVAQNVQPVINGNPEVDPGFGCDSDGLLQSVLAVPLNSAHAPAPVLALYRGPKDSFTRADFDLLSAVQANIATALQNALAYRDAEYKAHLDPLTGLLSRPQFVSLLDDEISQARRTRQPVALVIAELPAYASLAGSAGERLADDLLIDIGRGLRRVSRGCDRLGRIQENRFALVLPGVKAAHLIAILDRIRHITHQSSSATFGRAVQLTSAGAFYPDDADGARHLLAVAEKRLDGSAERWEDSVRALIEAGGTSVDATRLTNQPQ